MSDAPLVTVDGTPLKVSLGRAKRKAKIRALLLVAPLFLFILLTFFIPIMSMLLRSVDNENVAYTLPNTADLLAEWDVDSGDLPDEAVFAALAADFKAATVSKEDDINATKVGTRFNYEKSGFRSMFRKTNKIFEKGGVEPPYKEAFIKINKRWGDADYWRVMQREMRGKTDSYYLAAVDSGYTDDGERAMNKPGKRIYLKLYGRTLGISLLITCICLLLAYPVAYLLSILKSRTSNLLMILVLLPFWTSLLVRTSAWIALLQKEGVINSVLVSIGVIDDANRLLMIHNATGTIIAMVHVLLPFMILPLYSVMKTIPPSYMRAARSLGATPFTAFTKVYMPNTVPGIGAGAILVFILAIGYYITPALVGGQSGTLISNEIARHLETSLNWGLAAALGALLLVAVFALYLVYDKIVGIDNMKLG